MKKITELHDHAMLLADKADIKSAACKEKQASKLYLQAYELELEAADILFKSGSIEPTSSIIHRSAASLAMQLDKYLEAERLICRALSGNPPIEIAEQLRNLWEQVTFRRHLKIEDVTISNVEIVISMWGKYIGQGFASCDEVIARLTNAQKLLYRTAARLSKIPFNENNFKPRNLQENFQVWTSTPKAASYAFVLRVGSKHKQQMMSFMPDPSKIITELMDCFELINKNQFNAIQQKFDDEAYLRNFIALTDLLAPNNKITAVGLSSNINNNTRELSLQKPRFIHDDEYNNLFSKGKITVNYYEPCQAEGRLLVADSNKLNNGIITIVDSVNKAHNIHVPKGMMSDIVRPYFEKLVIISGVKCGGKFVLESISEIK